MTAGVLLAGVGATTATSRYVGRSINMTAPTRDCSAAALIDRAGLEGDSAAVGATTAAQVHVMDDEMACWGTWVLRNDGVLPVHVADLELPVGGPGGQGFTIDAHRFDGRRESATFAYGDPANGQIVQTEIYLGTTIAPGDTRTLGLRVVPFGSGCIEAGTTTRAAFTLNASIGPVGGGRLQEGQTDTADAPPDDPALVLYATKDLGDC
ncbi:hypothetical protein [Aquipuribacter sp. MA13-6]|uniref:hypothetical protein n=1 Tax=unclassified Aquipuribacter TaxID=2635084 RepID=UPI003EEEA570